MTASSAAMELALKHDSGSVSHEELSSVDDESSIDGVSAGEGVLAIESKLLQCSSDISKPLVEKCFWSI
jgi:hypothetical protein